MSDRYEIREKLGQGGLGAVYKAYDKQLKREVALKRVLTPTQEAVDSLLHEATSLSSLMHPNIVTVFDVGQDDQGGFVVMELLDGETLDDTISRAPLTLPDFAEVVNQTLEALIAAQAVNMTHRDLKPSNVMVIWRPSGRFQLKILDFGLAKISAAPTPQTSDQEEGIMGSIYFMAPEQFERTTLDFRTDMYALGCIYYYCLTGLYPFDGETAPQVMMSHLHHLVRPLEVVRPDIPEEVGDWVMWLMERNREDRPGSAREALDRFPDLTRPTPVISGAIPRDGTVRASPAPPLISEAAWAAAADPASAKAKAGAPTHALSQVRPKPPGSRSGGALRSSVVPKSGRDKKGGSGATGPVEVVAAADSRSPDEVKAAKRKTLMVILGSSVSALILCLVGAIFVAGNVQKGKAAARIQELEKTPSGDAKDVALLLRRISKNPKANDPRAPVILGKLRGEGVDEALRVELAKAGPGPQREALLQVVASRSLAGSFPIVLDIYRKSTVPAERGPALQSLVRIAGQAEVSALLGLLKLPTMDDAGRKELEIGIASLILREGDVVRRIEPVLNELASATGPARTSLARVAGMVGGGEGVLDRFLGKILEGSPPDLIEALSLWPDRSCKEKLGVLMAGSERDVKVAAARAYIRMLQLPSSNPDDTAGYRLVLEAGDLNDAPKLFAAIAGNPTPQTLKFCKETKFMGLEKSFSEAAAQVDKSIKEAVVIKSGQLVPAARARILGEDDGTRYSKEGDQIDWKTSRSWMSWVVKMEAPGNYEVSIVGSCPDNSGSEVKVTFVDEPLKAKTKKTAPGKTGEALTVGKVTIEPPDQQVRLLYLSAGDAVQPPGIMKIKGIRFTKK